MQERVEALLHRHAKSWRLVERTPGEGGRMVLSYLVHLKKKTSPDTLVAAASALGATAEFVPPAT